MMTTKNGLSIHKVALEDGGFSVYLYMPNEDFFGEVTFSDRMDQWKWKSASTSHLTQAIEWADEDFAESEAAREAKDAQFEHHWESVVNKYGGEEKD